MGRNPAGLLEPTMTPGTEEKERRGLSEGVGGAIVEPCRDVAGPSGRHGAHPGEGTTQGCSKGPGSTTRTNQASAGAANSILSSEKNAWQHGRRRRKVYLVAGGRAGHRGNPPDTLSPSEPRS